MSEPSPRSLTPAPCVAWLVGAVGACSQLQDHPSLGHKPPSSAEYSVQIRWLHPSCSFLAPKEICGPQGMVGGLEETLSTLTHLGFNAVKGTQHSAEPALQLCTVFKYTLQDPGHHH